MLLSPDRDWAVNEFEITEDYSGSTKTIHRTNSYRKSDGIPLIESSTVTYSLRKKDGTTDASVNTLAYRFVREVAPESDFQLSAFGLPEPVGVVGKSRTPMYVWFIAASAGCAIGAMGFRRLARRGVSQSSV